MRYLSTVLLLVGLASGGTPAAAQPATAVRRFAGSTVLLNNGDTLRGPLMLYPAKDLLVLRRADGTLRTLTPWLVRSFAVKGELTNFGTGALHSTPAILQQPTEQAQLLDQVLTTLVDTLQVRTFLSYRVPPSRAAASCAPGFYEVLSEGNLSLLRREEMRTKLAPVRHVRDTGVHAGTPQQPRRAESWQLVSQYFLFLPGGTLQPLLHPEQELAAVLASRAPALHAYVQQQGLSYARAADLRRIVSYADQLLAPH